TVEPTIGPLLARGKTGQRGRENTEDLSPSTQGCGDGGGDPHLARDPLGTVVGGAVEDAFTADDRLLASHGLHDEVAFGVADLVTDVVPGPWWRTPTLGVHRHVADEPIVVVQVDEAMVGELGNEDPGHPFDRGIELQSTVQ